MKINTLLSIIMLTIGLVDPWQAAAQAFVKADSLALASAVALARQPYTLATQAEARLVSGTEYVNYSRPNASGHQFFQSATAQPASLDFDGQLFTDVPLLYDLKRDKVLMPLEGRNATVQLLAEKVRAFAFGGHQFVRIVSADTAAAAAVPTGYYDLLLAGNSSLLARRTKREVQESTAGHLVFSYEEKTRLFVQRSGTLSEVATLKNILGVLPEHKAELQKFARSNHLRFNDEHREESAIALLRYYNTLAR